MKKTSLHYYHPGAISRLEQQLNARSAEGWQTVKAGRLLQHYESDPSVCSVYRFGVCEARPGSAAEITYLAQNERAGWTLTARRGAWYLFCKPLAEASEGEALPDGRAGMTALFEKRCKTRETVRMWMIILATGLMLGGYFTDCLPVLYSFALPMLLALLATLEIKYLQEGISHE